MSQSVLASFDPFAVHPFTSNRGLRPQPPQPSRYPAPSPSPTSASTFAAAPASPSSSPPSSSSQSPVHSPRPHRANSPGSPHTHRQQPIFVPFRPERSSPDLGDILNKKKIVNGFSFGSEPSSPPLGKGSDAKGKQ